MERDTARSVAARYHERIGALSGAQRLDLAAGLTEGVRALAEAGLRERNPGASEAEIRVRLAVLLYGPRAAERLSRRAR